MTVTSTTPSREDHYRLLFEQAAVGMARVSRDGRWLEVNERFAAMLGYTPAELARCTFADVTHPDERERDLNAARSLMDGAIDRYSVEKRYIRKDGSIVWAQLTTRYIRGESEEESFFISVIEDTTRRKQAEAARRASEARYRALVEASARMVWVTTAVGEFEEPQPDWAVYTGQTFEEYRGWGWLDAIHPADQARTGKTWAQAVESRTICELEYRIRRHDGTYHWFQVRAVPVIDDTGHIREWVGAEIDVEERVRRRQRAELLVNAGRLLAEPADPEALLERIAQLTIGSIEQPGVADGCLITLARADNQFDHVTVVSTDPGKARLVAEINSRYPVPPEVPHGFPAVIRTGRPELVPAEAFDTEVLPSMAVDEEHLRLMQSLDMYSGMCVPLRARGRTLGALTLVLHGPERRSPFDAADLATAEELARRAALALDNARLHTEALSANERLQQQAEEMELQAEELEATATELEEHAERLERAEREATAAREHLARTFAQAPVALAVVEGPDFRFTLANPLYEELSGRQVLGLTAREAFPEIADEIFGLLDQVYTTGEPFRGEAQLVPLKGPDGGLVDRWFDFTYQPLRGPDDRVFGIAVAVIEVTAQVRARHVAVENERQLRTLADAIPTLAWTAKADGYIDWYNARWYEYTGTTPEQMEGWGWQSVHDPEVLPQVLERWRASIATGEPFEMTFPLRGADGRFRHFLTRVSPVKDADGRVQRWFGTNTDVDTERAARDAAERARAAAEDANQAKLNFLATMSHELRTPLNAISGYADLLAMGLHGPITEEQRDAIIRIQRSQRHLLGLINDVLNFAKLEAGRVEYAIADVPVQRALDGIEPLVAPQLREKGLAFSVDECGDLVVRADEEKLQQILVNLLSNATKFTPSGGSVRVRCTRRDGRVRIAVADTGVGIAEDRHEQIFAPFVQIDRRLNAPNEGTGLGLAISRDLARAMGGDLTVQSAIGKGATFTVDLPAAPG